MIFTVSTVRDSLDNVTRHVQRNLGAGADHLLLFLDAPDPEVEQYLTGHPNVTHVVTGADYWTPERPSSLNARQVTNANLAMAVLAGLSGEGGHWLFHIDADEVVQLDREALEALPGEVRVARLAPLEAVSQLQWPGEVTHFKRLLSRPELADLLERGVIEAPADGEPPNGSYFRGHVQGKIGVRPALDLRMQLHRAVTGHGASEQVLKPHDADWLRHLHYESHSGEEFVRKWMAHLAAGEIRLRDRRHRLREQIEAVVADGDLDEAGRQSALTAIYHDQIEDDFDTLLRLDLLVEPAVGDAQPRDFPAEVRHQFEHTWQLLLGTDKRFANPQQPQFSLIALFEDLRTAYGEDPELAGVLDRALETAGVAPADPPARARGLLARLRRRASGEASGRILRR